MPDQFLVFEKVLKKRRRTWKWRVCTTEGDVIMHGSESSRPAARYQADRALFLLLLSAPFSRSGLPLGLGPKPFPRLLSDLPFLYSAGLRRVGKI
jgi:hypothetical protein